MLFSKYRFVHIPNETLGWKIPSFCLSVFIAYMIKASNRVESSCGTRFVSSWWKTENIASPVCMCACCYISVCTPDYSLHSRAFLLSSVYWMTAAPTANAKFQWRIALNSLRLLLTMALMMMMLTMIIIRSFEDDIQSVQTNVRFSIWIITLREISESNISTIFI